MEEHARQISASAFKARCLALLDEVARTGVPLVITKRGKPVAQLGPVAAARSLEGSVLRCDDIVSPVLTDWSMDES